MHQILGLRDKSHAFFEKGWTAPSIAEILYAPAKFLEDIPKDEQWNLYFTEQHCIGEACRDWNFQDCIPFDIDHINVKKVEETAKVVCESIGIDYNKTGVVFSGHGIQLHVLIESAIQSTSYFKEKRELYKVIASKINYDLKAAGLKGSCDTSVFSASRLMRMPGTINRKPNKEDVLSYVVQAHMEFQGFSLETACGAEDITAKHQIHVNAYSKFPTPDTKGVQKGCEFLKWCKNNQSEVSEPQWYAMLSIVGRLKNGDSLVHEYSKNHPDYNEINTTFKTEQAIASAGPRTCEGVDAVWGNCKSCKFHTDNDVVSPISIQGEDFISTEGTGFHRLVTTANGNTRAVPVVSDLAKFYFKSVGRLFVNEGGGFYRYNEAEKVWETTSDLALASFAQQHFRPYPDNKLASEFIGFMRRNDVKPADWLVEASKRKLNLENGVLDLKTFQMFEHSSDFGFMQKLPYAYDEKATCPAFDKFMKDITCDRQDLEDILLEFMGYAISGDTCWQHKALILLGEGGNGKSTFNNVLKALVGTGHSTLNMKAINDDQKRAMLEGKLFNVGDENSPRSFINNDIFKSLISGDDIDIKIVYKKPYTIRNRTKLIFNCNKMIETDDKTRGMLRRLLFIPFDAEFRPGTDNFDAHIEDKLKGELPGILNRCIEGYNRLVRQRDFTKSESSADVLDDYQVDEHVNDIEIWSTTFLQVQNDKNLFVDVKTQAYPSYVDWCKRNETNPESKLNFTRALGKSLERVPTLKNKAWKKRVQEDGIKYQRIYGATLKSGF